MAPAGRQAPSGTVSFVFTDIEGSTRLLRRLGDRYPTVLERHRQVLRKAWRDHGGYEAGTSGDSMFLAFDDARAAVEACAEAQRLVAIQDWPAEGTVRVRMGVHSGLAAPRDGDYVALAVHQAARVMSAAHGGQVLVSEETAGRISALDTARLEPLGRYRLPDFDEPVVLYAVAGDGLPSGLPAVRALPADGRNFVAPITSLHGRDQVIADVADLTGPRRAVTLVGPGGSGKTRLATEVGLRATAHWPDGVWLVDLSALADEAQVVSALGTAIGAPGGAGDRWNEVIEHLRGRRALVILDCCEHLATASAAAARRLAATCPGCGVLATSRERLGFDGEQVVRVDTLPLPPPGAITAAAAMASPAVALFVERARAVRRDFTLDDADAPTVAEICRRLDGLPLALELAAARLTALSPADLLRGLSDRFRLLRSRDPSASERQRTMLGLLEWSDRLLDDAERACLRRLGVFGGAFSLEAAGAAVGDEALAGDEVTDLVLSLVEKSLASADLTANATRYRLLESVREFSERRMDDAGEVGAVAERLAGWFLDRLGPARRYGRGWKSAVAADVDNLRALIPLVAPTAPQQAQELAYVIGRYLDAVGAYREGIAETRRHVAALSHPSPARVSLLTSLGDLLLRVGDVSAAQETLQGAKDLHRVVGALPPWDDVAIERTDGDLLCRTGDNRGAADAARRALMQPLSRRGEARMWSQLGIASLGLGDHQAAWDAFEHELEAYRELDDEVFQATAEGNLAEIALRRGEPVLAARHQRACMDHALALGEAVMVAFSLIVAARLAAGEGSWEVAASLHAHADAMLAKTSLVLYEDDRRASDAMLEHARGRLGDAAFTRASEAGRDLPVDAAVSLAKELLDRAASG